MPPKLSATVFPRERSKYKNQHSTNRSVRRLMSVMRATLAEGGGIGQADLFRFVKSNGYQGGYYAFRLHLQKLVIWEEAHKHPDAPEVTDARKWSGKISSRVRGALSVRVYPGKADPQTCARCAAGEPTACAPLSTRRVRSTDGRPE